HGHLDHCGRLPLLVREGYNGPIYASSGTIDIATLVLNDAAKIEVDDTERENKKRLRLGLSLAVPKFTPKDVERVIKLFRPMSEDQDFSIGDGIKIRLSDAGHILGSCSIELTTDPNGNPTVIVFSG